MLQIHFITDANINDLMIGTFNITDVTGPQGFTGFQGFELRDLLVGDIKDLLVIKA